MRLFNWVVSIQSLYYFVTAMWAILHIESFMEVTGPKTDVWLVKTVGALLIPVSTCLAAFLIFNTDRRPAFVLGTISCIAFICVDFYYALSDVISNIYLLDGIVQIILLTGWIFSKVSYTR